MQHRNLDIATESLPNQVFKSNELNVIQPVVRFDVILILECYIHSRITSSDGNTIISCFVLIVLPMLFSSIFTMTFCAKKIKEIS